MSSTKSLSFHEDASIAQQQATTKNENEGMTIEEKFGSNSEKVSSALVRGRSYSKSAEPKWRSLSWRRSKSASTLSNGTVGKDEDASVRSRSTIGASVAANKDGRGTLRKSKSLKRIRGLFRGKSRLKDKEDIAGSETPELGVENLPSGDDGSTVYNVSLDGRSTASSANPPKASATELSRISESGKDYLLRVLILLMDTGTRRFELLQMVFDSKKALVSDVLNQVPVSVTEEVLRSQVYQAVITSSGKEVKPEQKLVDFCKGDDILVAVPENLSPIEVNRLSKPILSDPKVVDMLDSSGFDAKDWSQPKTNDRSLPNHNSGNADRKNRRIHDSKRNYFGNCAVFATICALIAIFLYFFHVYISTPIQPGHAVSPGIILSKCGLLKGWPYVGPACNPSYLEVDFENVSYYEGKQLAWIIRGNRCNDGAVKAKMCVDGLVFEKDGSLSLGGQPVKWLERQAEVGQDNEFQLTPWPFAEKPKIESLNFQTGKVPQTGDDESNIVLMEMGSGNLSNATQFSNKAAAADNDSS